VAAERYSEDGEVVYEHKTQAKKPDMGFWQKSDWLPQSQGIVKAKSKQNKLAKRRKQNTKTPSPTLISYAHAKRCRPICATSNRGEQNNASEKPKLTAMKFQKKAKTKAPCQNAMLGIAKKMFKSNVECREKKQKLSRANASLMSSKAADTSSSSIITRSIELHNDLAIEARRAALVISDQNLRNVMRSLDVILADDLDAELPEHRAVLATRRNSMRARCQLPVISAQIWRFTFSQ
jgi:hypothetical protein